MRRDEFEIEKLAEYARSKVLVYEHDRPDVGNILRRLSDLIPGLTFQILDDDLFQDGEDGWVDCDEKLISLPHRVKNDLNLKKPRARLTVVHEIAHPFLGQSGVFSRSTNDPRARNSSYVKLCEQQAWMFARAFLMPKRRIFEGMTAQDIAAKFGMSILAAQIRLTEIERMRRIETGQRREVPDFVKQFLKNSKTNGH